MTKEEKREYDRAYRAANKDSRAAYERERYQKNRADYIERSRKQRTSNPEKTAQYMREYYLANPEKAKERVVNYRKDNPGCRSAERRNRRARSSNGSHTNADVMAIFKNQRGLCAACSTKLFKSGKNKFHADHIQPLSKGGSNDKHNIQCLCPTCNLRKSAKDPIDWAKENCRLL
jgi:5-methylcytosine-specific restriction endonuclease McrA